MKPLAALPALALLIALTASGLAQTPAPAPTAGPWRARPVIIIDPRHYLPSPTPRPASKRHATPRPHATPRRRPLGAPTPETFQRLDTSPRPATRPRAL